ncbi:UNVERIFIED_ORG: hypothetical protein QOE_4015 [Clostridioides difficile F501]|jgi:hypothetical protein
MVCRSHHDANELVLANYTGTKRREANFTFSTARNEHRRRMRAQGGSGSAAKLTKPSAYRGKLASSTRYGYPHVRIQE